MSSLRYLSDWEWEQEIVEGVKGYVSRNGQRAYFKSILALGRGARPHGGFEFVGYLLARRIGLLVPEFFVCRLRDGSYGVGSMVIPEPQFRWRGLPLDLDEHEIIRKFDGPSIFATLLVFDVFVGNIDRNPRNLIYRPLDNYPWELYVIDHNDLFKGGSWLQSYTGHSDYRRFIVNYNTRLAKVFEVVLENHRSEIDSAIGKVQSIDDGDIAAMIQSIPVDFLSGVQKQRAFEVLQHRKNHLQEIFRE